MASQLSFTERYNALLGVAVLRLGYIGQPLYMGGREVSSEGYARFGLGEVRSRVYSESLPSLEGAKCHKCRAALAVTSVHETEQSSFSGTFAESHEKYTIAQGTLTCTKSAQHLVKLPSEDITVSVESTIAELVCLLDELADEMGY